MKLLIIIVPLFLISFSVKAGDILREDYRDKISNFSDQIVNNDPFSDSNSEFNKELDKVINEIVDKEMEILFTELGIEVTKEQVDEPVKVENDSSEPKKNCRKERRCRPTRFGAGSTCWTTEVCTPVQ
tara:strand:- start:162 stop:545 length:384 start_codon:yes stop_codon:yes gene_type:complete